MHFQVWLNCEDGPNIAEQLDWQHWLSLSQEQRDHQENLDGQCIGLWYYGIIEAPTPEDAIQRALADVDENDLDVYPGA